MGAILAVAILIDGLKPKPHLLTLPLQAFRKLRDVPGPSYGARGPYPTSLTYSTYARSHVNLQTNKQAIINI